jgi:hypothetical protein
MKKMYLLHHFYSKKNINSSVAGLKLCRSKYVRQQLKYLENSRWNFVSKMKPTAGCLYLFHIYIVFNVFFLVLKFKFYVFVGEYMQETGHVY